MKIQLMSDLHFEFGWKMYLENKPDVTLILAGDIDARPIERDEFIRHACVNREAVIMVAGNHEFYGHDYHETMWDLGMLDAEIENFHFLENDHIELNGVHFLGATLWSEPEWGVFNNINDHHVIEFHGRRLLVDDIAKMCRETKQYLDSQLQRIKGKKVVITHFGPDPALMNVRWLGNPRMNTYFWARGLQDTFQHADYWLFGHTHDPTEMEIDGCKFFCNPHGYVWSNGGQEHDNFNPELFLEI